MTRQDDLALAAFMAELEIRHHRSREREASAWVVVTVDDESGSVVHVTGLFETPEAALIEAGIRHAEDVRVNPETDVLWTHSVVPLFPPTPPKP